MASAPTTTTMRAWRVRHPGPMETGPLECVTTEVPQPGPAELLVAVHACGVCRTDLHVAEGDLPVHRKHVTPGHEVVGRLSRSGPTPKTRSRWGTGSGLHGCGTPAGYANTVAGATKTCARSRATPVGTPTAVTPSSPLSQRLTLTHCPAATATPNLPRCCAPASSAIAHCYVPNCHPVAAWGSTASAAAPTSPLRSRWHKAPKSM